MSAIVGSALALIVVAASGAVAPRYDRFGGWTGVRGRRTGYFHAERIEGAWWLIDPDGNGFFSKGVCHVSYQGDNCPALGFSPYERAAASRYGSPDRWAKAEARRLRDWGVNTIGAWSSPEMSKQRIAYAVIANLAAASSSALWQQGGFPDVFAPEFRESVERAAERICAPHRSDPWLLGYFTDNELRWGPDWRTRESLLETFMKLPEESPGRRRADTFLSENGDPDGTPTDAEKSRFLELAAGEYFRICRDAIRKSDPNHLILGCRFAGYAPDPVVRAMRGSVDVVSYNNYDHQAPVRMLEHLAAVTGKPVMVTEFSFKAMDSGLPNSRGGGRPVGTQQERADLFQAYVEALARLPECVGYQWFEWADEPKQGRFDGEDCNYGLVKIDDEPWELLTSRFRAVNSHLDSLHSGRHAGRSYLRGAPRIGRLGDHVAGGPSG